MGLKTRRRHPDSRTEGVRTAVLTSGGAGSVTRPQVCPEAVVIKGEYELDPKLSGASVVLTLADDSLQFIVSGRVTPFSMIEPSQSSVENCLRDHGSYFGLITNISSNGFEATLSWVNT